VHVKEGRSRVMGCICRRNRGIITHVQLIRFMAAPVCLAVLGVSATAWAQARDATKPAPSAAQPAPVLPCKPGQVCWRSEWTTFQPWEYGFTAASVGAIALLTTSKEYPSDGKYGGILFDDAVRDALLLESREAKDAAMVVGDVGFRGMALYPIVIDTVAVTWIGHGSSRVAWQMFWIDLQSLSLSGALALTAEKFVGRGRPSNRPCDADPNYEEYCGGGDRFASFFSGHTAIAATSAGLVCAHHQHLPLYGGGAGDTAACVAAVTIAATTGIARIANDRHWATDVLTGGIIGTISGYFLPVWLHYRNRSEGVLGTGWKPERHGMVLPWTSQGALGLSWTAVM